MTVINIVDIGLNHETAPVELRELLSFGDHNIDRVINAFKESNDILEFIVISTCNRVEIVFTTHRPKQARESTVEFLSRFGGIKKKDLLPALYIHDGREAVRHIFRVGASLDSMVVGEPQILGQVKEAYRTAAKHKTSSVILNRLMHRTFSLAKKIRTETDLSVYPVSVSFEAVELGKKIFGDLSGKNVLLIGAGEMAELAALYLMNSHTQEIMITNRTFDRALELARRFNGKAVSFPEMGDQLTEADIIIASTASREPIISFKQIKEVMRQRRNRPIFFLDIAVPRNVEPRVNEIENAYVYDIDDLKKIANSNMDKRKKEAVKAERMVDEEVIRFSEWLKTLDIVPTIIDLQSKCEKIRQVEMEKTLSNLGGLDSGQKKEIEKLTFSIIKKVLNDPIVFLKGRKDRSTRDLYLDVTRKLFDLDRDHGNMEGE